MHKDTYSKVLPTILQHNNLHISQDTKTMSVSLSTNEFIHTQPHMVPAEYERWVLFVEKCLCLWHNTTSWFCVYSEPVEGVVLDRGQEEIVCPIRGNLSCHWRQVLQYVWNLTLYNPLYLSLQFKTSQ